MHRKEPTGVVAALASAFFLGLAPVFGKLAIGEGFSPLATVALRTGFAAGALLLIVVVFYRRFLYIYPIGLVGCVLAGTINGAGSLLYYLALGRLEASVGQLLYSLYPFFVALWLMLDHQRPSRLTFFRIGLATLAVLLLTSDPRETSNLVGVLMMLGAAVLYAMHLPINQRVLYEVPAPTVTLYTLLSMSAVVIPTFWLFDRSWPPAHAPWWPIIGLSAVTFFARLSLFLGIKKIGGMQTALLGLGELLVTILFSHLWLKESLGSVQWVGALGLGLSLVLVYFEKDRAVLHTGTTGWLAWIRAPVLQKGLFGPSE